MNAKEIRDAAAALDVASESPEMERLSVEERGKALLMIVGSLAFSMICEVAAQFAEANESLKKIADPQVVNGTSPWVTMTYNGRTYMVNKGAVAIVEKCNETQCIITMHNEGGDNLGRWCDGTMKEVCSKLGIPVDGL
jgi:hypothetical protein